MNVSAMHSFVQFDRYHYNHIQQKNDHQLRNEYHIRKEHCGFQDVPSGDKTMNRYDVMMRILLYA